MRRGISSNDAARLGDMLTAFESGRLNIDQTPPEDGAPERIYHYLGKATEAIAAYTGDDEPDFGTVEVYLIDDDGVITDADYTEDAYNLTAAAISTNDLVSMLREPMSGELVIVAGGGSAGAESVSNIRGGRITGVTNNSPVCGITTSSNTGLVTGNHVNIFGVSGATGVNGTHVVTGVSGNLFSVTLASPPGVYTSATQGYVESNPVVANDAPGTASIISADANTGISFVQDTSLAAHSEAKATLAEATATQWGVVTPNTQTWAGNKTLNNDLTVIGNYLSSNGHMTLGTGYLLVGGRSLVDPDKVQVAWIGNGSSPPDGHFTMDISAARYSAFSGKLTVAGWHGVPTSFYFDPGDNTTAVLEMAGLRIPDPAVTVGAGAGYPWVRFGCKDISGGISGIQATEFMHMYASASLGPYILALDINGRLFQGNGSVWHQIGGGSGGGGFTGTLP